MCKQQEKKMKNPKFVYLNTEKNIEKTRGILFDWKTSKTLNDRPERAENTPD